MQTSKQTRIHHHSLSTVANGGFQAQPPNDSDTVYYKFRIYFQEYHSQTNAFAMNYMANLRIPGHTSRAVQFHPQGVNSIPPGSPHARPMRALSTCGEPDKIKENTNPKNITAFFRTVRRFPDFDVPTCPASSPAAECAKVRVVSRTIPPRRRTIRFTLRLALHTYDAPPWGARVVPDRLTKSRETPTRTMLPLFIACRLVSSTVCSRAHDGTT